MVADVPNPKRRPRTKGVVVVLVVMVMVPVPAALQSPQQCKSTIRNAAATAAVVQVDGLRRRDTTLPVVLSCGVPLLLLVRLLVIVVEQQDTGGCRGRGGRRCCAAGRPTKTTSGPNTIIMLRGSVVVVVDISLSLLLDTVGEYYQQGSQERDVVRCDGS